MNKASSDHAMDASSETLQALTDKWDKRHNTLENYVLLWHISHWFLRRIKIEFDSWKGKLIRFLLLGSIFWGIPLLITTILRQWNIAPLWTWAIVAFGLSAFSLVYPHYKKVGRRLSAFYKTIQDENGIKRMIAWDHRWFSRIFSCSAGVLFAVVTLFAMLNSQTGSWSLSTPIGTYFLIFVLAYQVGENTYNAIIMCVESYLWSGYKFQLNPISPLETIKLQEAVKGYDLVVFLNSILMTLIIAGSAVMVLGTPHLINRILLILLFIAYLVIGLLFFLPRIVFQRIIQLAKIRELAPLEDKLIVFYTNFEDLNTSDYGKFKRVEEIYNKIKGSPDNLLPLTSTVKIVGNLLLPTITFYLSVAAEVYLSTLLESIFR